MKESNKQQWLIAQKHEKSYYETGKNLVWGVPHNLEYWKKFLGLKTLEGRVIEVGCGPNGLYNFSENVIGIDPINFHKKNFIQGVGESLPFICGDLVICCNGLDHFQNPQKAVDEMFRITTERIVIWVYIYPKVVSWILNKFDKTHPFHFTKKDVWKLINGTYNRTIPAITCDYSVTKLKKLTFFDTHWKHTKSKFAKLKLFIAHLLGVRGLCLHLEVLNGEEN